MQLEDFTSKMHIPKEYIRVDNTNFFLFVLFCIGIASYFSYWFVTNPDVTVSDMSVPQQVAIEESMQADPNSQTFDAVLLEIGKDTTYIRVSITNRGVFSIGIRPDTIIKNQDGQMHIVDMNPFEKLSITAVDTPNTETYDFVASSILAVSSHRKGSDSSN